MSKWIFGAALFGLVFGSSATAFADRDSCKTTCEHTAKRCTDAAMKIKNEKTRNDARKVCADAKVRCRKDCDKTYAK